MPCQKWVVGSELLLCLSEIPLQVPQPCPWWWEIPPNFLSVLQAVGATAHAAPAAILTMSGSAQNLPPGGGQCCERQCNTTLGHSCLLQVPSVATFAQPTWLLGAGTAPMCYGPLISRGLITCSLNHTQLKSCHSKDCFREATTVNIIKDPGEKLPRVRCRQVQAYT